MRHLATLTLTAAAAAVCLSPACAEQPPKTEGQMSVTKSRFGSTDDGQAINLYTCRNTHGLVMKVTNYGAIVVALEAPDRDGRLANVTLGFGSLDGYLKRHPYFGSTVGRYCNRIAGGKFTLQGRQHTLATNNGPNHLHGGEKGFDKVIWQAEPVETREAVGVKFSYKSRDGEEGYPGNLDATVTYLLTEADEMRVEFTAATDKATPVNLTNHCYWNLSGAGSGDIKSHRLQIEADHYLPVDDTLIPTGEVAEVAGTPLDFRTAKPIGRDLEKIVADPVGYDHCFVLRNRDGELKLAARVSDPASGRVMEIKTTQPGLQFYSGNFLDGKPENGGYPQYSGLCLEAQHYPDSPNQKSFPTTILQPGETYRQVTVHRFSTE